MVVPEKFELKKMVESILPLFKELMLEKKINSIISMDSNIEVFADKNMVSTVFRNLITNAIKFSHPDSSFTIRAFNDKGIVQIEVIDHGIGISNKNLEKLFRIDQSFSNYGTNKEKGSGLGLIICKEFVKLNQGKIWVDSKLGKGSSFKFTLKSA
jgi:signal transduction histidine kinase